MNLEFSDDQLFIQNAAREFLTEHAGPALARKVLETPEVAYDADLWKGVAEMGWLGATVPEEFGGAGLGHLELVLIAEEIGRSLAPIPFASSVYGATEALMLAGSDAQKKEFLPRLASGELVGTLAVVEGAGPIDLESIACELRGDALHGEKIPVPDGQGAGLAVVAAREGGQVVLVLAELGDSSVKRSGLESIDPSRPLARVNFEGTPAQRLGGAKDGEAVLSQVLDRAAVMTGFEQIGGASAAFEVTKEFTMGRYAFGRPIASFQALKHRLADAYAAIEIARSNGYYAAWALSSGDEELSIAACSLRVSACEAFELATEEMIQMHGGVGFTWEYDCHLFYRRAQHLAAWLGRSSEWREQLIRRIEISKVL